MHLTPTQQKIMLLLADGKTHTREELFTCLPDDLGQLTNLNRHISNLRAKLKPRGEDIYCAQCGQTWCYAHVRRMASATDGKY